MIIMGVDPGYAITGYGVISDSHGKLEVIDYGVISTHSSTPFEHRLLSVFEGLEALIERFNPAVMAVEELFFNNNKTTAIGTAQARGMALLAGARAGIPVYEYTPLQVKKAVTGYGRAEKSQIQLMVRMLLCLRAQPKPDDAADALAVAICQAHTGRIQGFEAVGGYR
ncbi:MAG: crossover junction endodeoxyribonuclease RuvC [Fastidiosipilaceae bacterium]|jgi:crossover junction endodeoxyribonuclease RuvC